MGADLLDYGLDYLRRYGWSVFPTRGKLAAGKWKNFQEKRPTEKELHWMFQRQGLTGLAVILGAVSGDLWARDFDKAEAFPKWAAAFPDVTLPTVTTAKGFHVYGVWPGVRFADLGDGELRAGGGCYCLLPPSKHPDGPTYTWATGPPATIPRLDPASVGLNRPWCSDTPPREQRDRETGHGNRETEIQRFRESEEVGGESHRAPNRPETCPVTLPELIRQALPQSIRHNWNIGFHLARGMKALALARGREWTMQELEAEAFGPWYEQNRYLRPEQTRAEYFAEFLRGYDLVKYPLGAGVLDTVWAKSATIEPPPAARQFVSPELQRVVTFCSLLQVVAGAEPFYLSVRLLQGKLKLKSPRAASAILRRLVEVGILAEVEKGGRETNRATRFRYLAAADVEAQETPW